MSMNPDHPCPCASGQTYGRCCQPFHRGDARPATPEALMRSRYSAYVEGDETYLRESWHPSTCPESLALTPEMAWLGLRIIDAPQAAGDDGVVEFAASFRFGSRVDRLHERSRFVREQGRWFYLDGVLHGGAKPAKIGRNEPCPCGSGRKYKQCCGK